MKAMNSPGSHSGHGQPRGHRSRGQLWIQQRWPQAAVSPDMLFRIGSITKSFVALVCLQLHEEGKLDLHKPVLDLPALAADCHHLRSGFCPRPADSLLRTPRRAFGHSLRSRHPFRAGVEARRALLLLQPRLRHFEDLIQKLDGRTWAASVKARVLDPVGMRATAPVITNDIRPRTAQSWVPYFEARPYPRNGRLAPAANLQFDDAAGSIASTPGDMTLYMQMLLNRGQAPNARIISADSFALMSKPWIKAPDFGPTASYGYGIAVDTLDGHTILRHTGGMASFMSAINVV